MLLDVALLPVVALRHQLLTHKGMAMDRLTEFLNTASDATKAKYAAELDNAGAEFAAPLDNWYAESLVYFGLLERHVEVLYTPSGKHIRGSRTQFRKVPNDSIQLSIGRS